MACYIVIFEVTDSKRLPAIAKAFTSFPTQCRLTPHSWAVVVDLKAADLREKLKDTFEAGDQLFIIRSGTEAAWRNSFGPAYDEWLKKNL